MLNKEYYIAYVQILSILMQIDFSEYHSEEAMFLLTLSVVNFIACETERGIGIPPSLF